MSHNAQYDLKSVKLPRLAGSGLRIFAALLENPATRWALIGRLLRDGGITKLRELVVDEPPTFQPSTPWERHAPSSAPPDLARLSQMPGPKGFSFATIQAFADAYRSGVATPEQIADKVLDAMAASDARTPPLRAFIASNRDDVKAQARGSAQRFREGKSLGVLDGVPVAIKDELDMLPYGTTVGTRFLGRTPALADSTVAARLRAAGALLIGKTNMHEIGFAVTGLNPHHGMARNPYHPDHYTGGSSSGSAAAVAAGLCPVAIGADGGGSIRIPSAFCGMVGLKPTYGRVSVAGGAPLAWSVDHYGPIAATAYDAALIYAIVAGPDPKDASTLRQPPVTLENFEKLDLHGLTLGVYWPWFRHATPAMVEGCEKLLKQLEEMGACVREVEIPDLDATRIAHLATIATELATAMDHYYGAHRSDFGLDVRINLALAQSFTSRDYVQAQRIRTRAIANFDRALEKVDAIVTPATGVTAPAVPSDALPDGESDLTTLMEIMRYTIPPNLTGHPAIAFPAGYDLQGLPVGFQAIGRFWEEHVLLRLAHAAEQVVEKRAPQIHYKILADN